jgi:hypothetical protein
MLVQALQDSCGPNGTFYRESFYEVDPTTTFVKSGLERGLFRDMNPKPKELPSTLPSTLPPEDTEDSLIETVEVDLDNPVVDETPIVAPPPRRRK